MSNSYKNIQNPFIVSNILTLPTEGDSIEITMKNVFQYFKTVYVLVKKNDIPLNTKYFSKEINEETYNELTNNLVIWKSTLHLLKNKINFDKVVILHKDKLQPFNQFNIQLNDYNLVLPIFTVAFKNIVSYLENKTGESNLENIYNNLVLSTYFKDDMKNIKNKLQLEHLISSIDDSNYWTHEYNCQTNMTNIFKLRKLNNIFMKKLSGVLQNKQETNNEDYLQMIFKNKKYVDPSILLKKHSYKLYNVTSKSIYSKNDINSLFEMLDEKQKYLLFCNLLISKKHCHLVINNMTILDMMKNKIGKFPHLFRYLISYSWIRFYFEESIKKSNLKSSDDIVFDIDTASKLPVFPFVHDLAKFNPYMPILVSNAQLKSSQNINGLKEFKMTNQNMIIFNQGICNLNEFKRNVNLFVTNKPDMDLFAGFDWGKYRVAMSGSIMTACLQKKHPLMNIFNEKNEDEKKIRYFNEYYASSDIDLMFLTQDPLEYMKNVNEFYNQVVVNTCVNFQYAETDHIKLNPLFQIHVIVQKNWVTENIINENLTYDFILKNIEDQSIIGLFKPYIKTALEKKINDKFNTEELKSEAFKNYPDYFLDFDKYEIKIHIYGSSSKTDKINILEVDDSKSVDPSDVPIIQKPDFEIKINYKYRIISPHFNHPIELFMAKGDDFMGLVSQFHLPCVRAYYDGYNVYMTPSCITAHMTYMNIDYKYFAGTKDPIEIINKNRMRGFGTWMNLNEIENIIQYSTEVPFWANMYGKNINEIKGNLPIGHNIFHPRTVNADQFYDAPPIDLENGYILTNYDTINTIDDINIQMNLRFDVKEVNMSLNEFNSIDKDGSIIPVQKWIIEAYYEYNKMMNKVIEPPKEIAY